eukprot:gnl/MRDRNA2_/MRDRNA2_79209_c0_seq4.p1 gnl/MRDRNA2_/MRDRNA2_79209_c0~~gnl/MRDRNA2_/MRDRNA2_79209_c0_seq4.p1  ORF type:complete len:465 (+),score=97.45 gnl/MRDRNA2_/MRDRNA2_79209_c0_seq4:21-1415(+)
MNQKPFFVSTRSKRRTPFLVVRILQKFWYVKASDGRGVPVLMKGAAKQMPAFKKWKDDEGIVRLYKEEKLDQVETEKLETRTKRAFDDWTVAKFIRNYKKKNIYATPKTPHKMAKDVWILPVFNCGGYRKKLSSTMLWWSNGGTECLVHYDGWHNQHCSFAGSKNWILWHPSSGIDRRDMGWVNAEEEYLDHGNQDFKNAYGCYVGKIKSHDMDTTLQTYPEWDELQWWNMTLEAGDCAYIPPKWFHFVQSPPQRSIGVNMWFGAPKKFADGSCKKLVKRGYDIKQSIFTLGDCEFGYGETQGRTDCKLPKGKGAPQTPKNDGGRKERTGKAKELVAATKPPLAHMAKNKCKEAEAEVKVANWPFADAVDVSNAAVTKKRRLDIQANFQNRRSTFEGKAKAQYKAPKPKSQDLHLFSQNLHNIISIFHALLLSFCVGTVITRSMFYCFWSGSTTRKELLLNTCT